MALDLQLEHRLADEVNAWASVLAGVHDRGDDEVLAAVERLGSIRRLVDAMGAQLAGALERRCSEGALAARLGEKSAASIVAAFAGIEPAEARAWCELGAAVVARQSMFGEQLEPRRPLLAGAAERAELGVMAGARIAAALDELERRAPERVDAAAALLIENAGRLTTRELIRVCRHLIDTSDPDGVELREEELRRRSGLQICRTADGLVRWVVTMHPEAVGFLTTALDARTAPRREPRFGDTLVGSEDALPEDAPPEYALPGHEETRTLAQRRLDALVSIARESLEHDPGQVAGTAVTMVVTIPLEALRAGIGAAQIEGVDAPISAATARRLAAQADLIPAVLGGPSEPLDLGRSQRLFSSGQRRAAAMRDGGCLWPGCPAPPGWCELAHVEAWASGGSTDLRNAALLCPYHHRRFDRDGWKLESHAGARYLIPPAWVDVWRRPRRVGRADLAA